jgi:hypothetical protein
MDRIISDLTGVLRELKKYDKLQRLGIFLGEHSLYDPKLLVSTPALPPRKPRRNGTNCNGFLEGISRLSLSALAIPIEWLEHDPKAGDSDIPFWISFPIAKSLHEIVLDAPPPGPSSDGVQKWDGIIAMAKRLVAIAAQGDHSGVLPRVVLRSPEASNSSKVAETPWGRVEVVTRTYESYPVVHPLNWEK